MPVRHAAEKRARMIESALTGCTVARTGGLVTSDVTRRPSEGTLNKCARIRGLPKSVAAAKRHCQSFVLCVRWSRMRGPSPR
jgi:hypothetical protein